MTSAEFWSLTSKASHLPPFFSISATRSGVRDGLREVAIRLCPLARTMRARARPKPEEQPVMSQVRGRLGVVNVAAMSGWVLGGIEGSGWELRVGGGYLGWYGVP